MQRGVALAPGGVAMPVSAGGTAAGRHTMIDSPVAAVQEYLFHLSHGSLSFLFGLLPARVVRQVGRDALATALSSSAMRVRRRGGLRRVICSGDSGDEQEALVSVTMMFADGTVERSLVVVVREDGAWRLDLLR
jgi:hypothetical protein